MSITQYVIEESGKEVDNGKYGGVSRSTLLGGEGPKGDNNCDVKGDGVLEESADDLLYPCSGGG